MNIYRNIEDIKFDLNTVITVGTFDGVHLGHKQIIETLIYIANEKKYRNFIVTLDPHPRIVLQKNNPEKSEIKLLNNLEDRLQLFESYGIENVLVINFTEDFAKTSPTQFIEDIIYSKIGFKHFLIGYDHSFGKDREGDIHLLNNIKDRLNFEVTKVEPYLINEDTISSTKIRKAIAENQIQKANKYLGYNYFIKGTVIEGDKRGRKIGFPTANIDINDNFKLIPPVGVYTVKVEIVNKLPKSVYFGMANIGFRPTFYDEKKLSIEVNIFDFEEDIYNKEVRVEFLHHLRNEQKFNGIDEIINQLKLDKQKSIELLNL